MNGMTILDLKRQFSQFLTSDPERLHFAAHSHAYWPDVTRAAQLQLWDDAAELVDEKWTRVLGEVWPAVTSGIAEHLRLVFDDEDALHERGRESAASPGHQAPPTKVVVRKSRRSAVL